MPLLVPSHPHFDFLILCVPYLLEVKTFVVSVVLENSFYLKELPTNKHQISREKSGKSLVSVGVKIKISCKKKFS